MKRAQRVSRIFFMLFIAASLAFAVNLPARAQYNPQDQQDDYSHVRIVRLSFVVGDVQYQRGEEAWQDAPMNLPIQEGFRLATGNGRAEIEFENGVILRLAENTQLEFTQLGLRNGVRITQINVVQGTILAQANLKGSDAFSVTAPNLQVNVLRSGRFRIDTVQGDSWVSVFKNEVSVSSASGETRISSGHTLYVGAANPDQTKIDLNAQPDDFDRWAADRDNVIEQAYRQVAPYISNYSGGEYSYGVEDLSSYGRFTAVPGYGVCWQPYGVGVNWSPFFNGVFNFFGGTGWTWISSEPWGWLPYHTGNWFFANGGWFWQPGPLRTWYPAPVHWVRVDGELGWRPRGPIRRDGQVPANGVVLTGEGMRNGQIRPGGRGPLSPEMAGRIEREKAPAPFVRVREQGGNGATSGTPPARTWEHQQRGSIVMDPATRTYINTHQGEVRGDGRGDVRTNGQVNGQTQTGGQQPRRGAFDPTKESAGPPAMQEHGGQQNSTPIVTPRRTPENPNNPTKDSAGPPAMQERVAPPNSTPTVMPRRNPENTTRDSAGPPAMQENGNGLVNGTGGNAGGGNAPAVKPTPSQPEQIRMPEERRMPEQQRIPEQQQVRPAPVAPQPQPQQQQQPRYTPPPQQQTAPQQHYTPPPAQQSAPVQHSAPTPAPAPASAPPASHGGGGAGTPSSPPPSPPPASTPPPKGGRGDHRR